MEYLLSSYLGSVVVVVAGLVELNFDFGQYCSALVPHWVCTCTAFLWPADR